MKKSRRRKKKVNSSIWFAGFSIAMIAWSVHLFTTQEACSAGGSKLSAIFALLCVYFGTVGQAFVYLVFGIGVGVVAWKKFSGSQKSN